MAFTRHLEGFRQSGVEREILVGTKEISRAIQSGPGKGEFVEYRLRVAEEVGAVSVII